MKERIRRFYEDHKEGCDLAVTSMAALGALFALHKARGYRVEKVGHWENSEGTQLITIGLKNGDTRVFSKQPVA